MFPGGYGSGLGVGGWLFMIDFWGALIAVAVWAVTRLFPSSGSTMDLSDTQDAAASSEGLDRQLAVGDIDPDAYWRLKDELAVAGWR